MHIAAAQETVHRLIPGIDERPVSPRASAKRRGGDKAGASEPEKSGGGNCYGYDVVRGPSNAGELCVSYAAQLPSRQARDDYLAERRRELVSGAQAEGATAPDAAILADACVNAARRVMTELLAQRAGVPHGRA
jgi:hypothetical protein